MRIPIHAASKNCPTKKEPGLVALARRFTRPHQQAKKEPTYRVGIAAALRGLTCGCAVPQGLSPDCASRHSRLTGSGLSRKVLKAQHPDGEAAANNATAARRRLPMISCERFSLYGSMRSCRIRFLRKVLAWISATQGGCSGFFFRRHQKDLDCDYPPGGSCEQ